MPHHPGPLGFHILLAELHEYHCRLSAGGVVMGKIGRMIFNVFKDIDAQIYRDLLKSD